MIDPSAALPFPGGGRANGAAAPYFPLLGFPLLGPSGPPLAAAPSLASPGTARPPCIPSR